MITMSEIEVLPTTEELIIDQKSEEAIRKGQMPTIEYLVAMFEGRVRNSNWKEHRRKALLNCRDIMMKSLKENRSKQESNYELFFSHLDELITLLPGFIGCCNGKIVVGENEFEVVSHLDNAFNHIIVKVD